jgi:hypothetical protein
LVLVVVFRAPAEIEVSHAIFSEEFIMSIDRPESYLTNTDIQIAVNDRGVSVSYGGSAAAGNAGQDFVRRVAYESGAAMAGIVNARGEVPEGRVSAIELLPGFRWLGDPEKVTPDAASVQHDPVVIAAKEITKPAVPLPAADAPPVVIGKEPPGRDFDLPPQHIIDAKTITVTETPIGPDGAPMAPVVSKFMALESGMKLPLSENFEQTLADAEFALSKSFIIPPERLRQVCTNAYDELVEKMNGVVGPFSVYTEDELRRLFSNADDVALIRHYLENEVRPLLDIVLSRACRNVLPPEAIEAGEEMEEIVRGIERALNIEYDPGLLERIGQTVVDGVRDAVRGAGDAGEGIRRWFRNLGQDPSRPVSTPPFPLPAWDPLRQPN